MATVLASPVPKLDEVRSILLTKTTWQLPQDLKEKADGFKVVSLDHLKKLPMSQCLEIFSPVHRVALISAAAHLAVPAPQIAQTLINIFNELPGPAYNATAEFNNSPYDFTPGKPITDANFSNFLKQLYPDASKETVEILEQPYVSAAQVLLLVATMEMVSDYALIATVLDAEFKGAALLSSETFSRETAPQFVSIVAQRIFDIALNSKNLRKKGSDILSNVPKLFAPIFAAVAQLRTAVAKPQHFFDKFTLFSYTSGIVYSTNEICKYLGKEVNATVENATQLLASAAFAMISSLAPKVQEMIEKKRLTVGTISKEIAVNVAENGPAALSTMAFYQPPAGKKVLPKEAVGCIDLLPKQMKVREEVIKLVTSIFKRHGAVSIDTPVFELRSVLTEKYGEESKLIYNLEDQGGELLSLRYDLTVPFARFVATHGITKIRRYHIAKVYRRDKPAIERGRFREFYQCDFDIAGTSGPMIADAEVISIVSELLSAIGKLCQLDNFNYSIRVSHRQLLSAMTKVAGVPDEKFKTVCSSVDKLDKLPWADVARELVDVKGLFQAAADKLAEFVSIQGRPMDVLAALRQKADFVAVAGKVLDEMEILFGYLEAIGCLDKINFDLSLARGLDYYTGVIYEAGTTSGEVGSIAGGGRYDGLIGMFSGKPVPAVGVSLGIERIFALIEKLKSGQEVKEADTEVYVAGIFSDYTKKRFELASKFWELGIATEIFPKAVPDIKTQLQAAEQVGAKVFVLFAPDELAKGVVKIREITPKGVKREPIERVVPEADLVQETIKLLEDVKKL
uniref:histidine--tRNA ligase n=2 Tax=Trichomonas tenax TaxID=43075 RepID=A0A7H4L1C1_9EUKA|nr:histidyl tRNA synthetase [Trichomonas tenax]